MLFKNLNLDLGSYNLSELKQLFSIDKKYSDDIIDLNKNKLLNQVYTNSELINTQKKELEDFINKGADILSKNTSENKDGSVGTWSQKFNPITEVGSNIIIDNPNSVEGKKAFITEGRISGSDDAPPGWLNPINIKTTASGINIDSRFRENYYGTSSSDFSLELPFKQEKVINMRIGTLDIPMSFYGVDRARGDATLLVTTTTEIEPNTTYSEGTYLDLSDPSQPVPLDFQSVLEIGSTLPSGEYNKDSATFRQAWLVIIPDGNYECQWHSRSEAADFTNVVNTALSIATKGIFFRDTGKFFAHACTNPSFAFGEGPQYIPDITNGLNPNNTLCFTVDRVSGRAIFSIPSTCGSNTSLGTHAGALNPDSSEPEPEAECDVETDPLSLSSTGYYIYFNASPGGSLSFTSNIQLFLGWQMGYRAGSYKCINSMSCVSESPCMITGPRYMFISIGDGTNSGASNYIASFAQSTLAEDIITRVNLSTAITTYGTYKIASDVGLSNQLNRSREYYGPVSIHKLVIKLLDEYGRILSLNGVDWSMSILFEKLYD